MWGSMLRGLIEDLETHLGSDLSEDLTPNDVFWKIVDRNKYMQLRRALRDEEGDSAMLRTILQALIEKVTPKGNDGVALMKLQNLVHNGAKLPQADLRNQLGKIGDLLGVKAPKQFKELWMKREDTDDA